MIVQVQFRSKNSKNSFSGMEYSYNCEIPVCVGDVVSVPTSTGTGVARITAVNIPPESVESSIRSKLKTIIGHYLEDEPKQLAIPALDNHHIDSDDICINPNLITVVQLPVLENQLRDLKYTVENRVADMNSMLCTEETRKSVKAARAQLNKERTALENILKNIKKTIMAPYEQLEATFDECVRRPYADADALAKLKIDEVEAGLKNQKLQIIMDYFNEFRDSLGLDDEFAPWANAGIKVGLSDSEKQLKEQVKAYLRGVHMHLSTIDGMDYRDEILAEYKVYKDFAFAIKTVTARHRIMEEQAERRKAEAERRSEEKSHENEIMRIVQEQSVVSPPQPIIDDSVIPSENVDAPKYETAFKVTGTIEQLKELKNFLINGGYNYEQL